MWLFLFPLNLHPYRNFVNIFATNIRRGQSVQLFVQIILPRPYLFNELLRTWPSFYVTLDTGTTTAKADFLEQHCDLLKKIYLSLPLIAMGDVVLAVESYNVINIDCYSSSQRWNLQLSQIRIFKRFKDTDINIPAKLVSTPPNMRAIFLRFHIPLNYSVWTLEIWNLMKKCV